MPTHDVEGGVILHGRPKLVVVLAVHSPLRRRVLVKGRYRYLKISRIGQTIGSDRAQLGKFEVTVEHLEDIAPDRPGGLDDAILDAARDHDNLVRAGEDVAELSLDIQDAVLRDDKEVAVARVESGAVSHGGARGVDEDGET